jgi:hypothetical protein
VPGSVHAQDLKMARWNVAGQLAALLAALETQDFAQADAAAVRFAAALRRSPEGVQSISAAAFDKLLCYLSSPVSKRAYQVAACATSACLVAEGDDESRFATQICRAAGCAAALVRGITSHNAALRLRIMLALPCVFPAMLHTFSEQEQIRFDTAIAEVGESSCRRRPRAAAPNGLNVPRRPALPSPQRAACMRHMRSAKKALTGARAPCTVCRATLHATRA